MGKDKHKTPISTALRNMMGERSGLGEYQYHNFLADAVPNNVVAR